jgi:triosephosphate isomerase
MRRKIIAGNWKMYKSPAETREFGEELKQLYKTPPKDYEICIFPTYLCIDSLVESWKGLEGFHVGAQNCHWANMGAYTGEISAAMLVDVQADHVLIGHSERRQYQKETHQELQAKVMTALDFDLQVVYCCGEMLDDRQADKHFDVVTRQLDEVLGKLHPRALPNLIVAYEPVWAIGTGVTATPAQAQEMHAFIRRHLKKILGSKAERTPILYGGSVKQNNALSLFSMGDIDGALIGGASLQAGDFWAIAQAMSQALS